MPDLAWRTVVRALVAGRVGAQAELPGRVRLTQLEDMTAALAAQLGSRPIVTRILRRHQDETARCDEIDLEIEGDETPRDGWPPWSRRGWFAEAAAWIEARASEHGLRLIDRVEQLRNVGVACILRAPTDRGAVFFKATTLAPPFFADEARLLAALADRFPVNVPALLAADSARGWMLLADAGPVSEQPPTIDLSERTLRRFGEMQRAYAADPATLLAAGATDRRLASLTREIDPLLNGDLGELAPEDAVRLRRTAPPLKRCCDELAALGVPETLGHGDLHFGNIALSDGEPVFFDWTDGGVTHPFLDVAVQLAAARDDHLVDPPALERLRDAYLELWSDIAPSETLRRALRLAQPLGALHNAIMFSRAVETMHPRDRWQIVWGLPGELRRVLSALDELTR